VTVLDQISSAARTLFRAALLFVLAGCVLDIPAMFGRYYYTEQFLALAAGLCAAMVLAAPGEKWPVWLTALNLVFAVFVLCLFLYVMVHYPQLQLELAMAPPAAVGLGLLMIAGILEAVRRRTGLFLPLLLLALAAFCFIGPHLPDSFQTRPVSFSRLVAYLALDTNALFSKILAIAAIVVAPFIVFGFLLNAFGGSAVFSTLAARLVGRYKGGPAKVSVAGSAAFGMVSGSAVANVVAVGSVSIPMMVRAGYSRPVAAAIEAVASTGGQLMPPIMGASAFLMAELLELPYRDVALAAILPSLLFYAALFLSVDFEARRLDIEGDADAAAKLAGEGGVFGRVEQGWRYMLPVAILIYLLFWENRSAEYAGLISTAALILVHLPWPLRGFFDRIVEIWKALLASMDSIGDIVMLAAAAGLVIGVLNITGVSFAITLQMLAVSGGILGVLLFLTAVLSIVLGLGMPTVGVYVLLATLAAPALVELGVQPIAGHMYVLYFGMLSMITPPIAIASFAAATVAQTDPWKTSFASLKVGAGVYLVPVAFVLQPELLLSGDWSEIALALARTLTAILLLSAAAVGHVVRPLCLPMRTAAALLALPNCLPYGSWLPDAVLWGMFVSALALSVWLVKPGPATVPAGRISG